MKEMIRAVMLGLFLGLCLVLSSCAPISQPVNQITTLGGKTVTLGMTMQEVRAELGPPESIYMPENDQTHLLLRGALFGPNDPFAGQYKDKTVWHYPDISVTFVRDNVTELE